MDWFSRTIDAIKLFFSTRITVGICVTSGFLCFLSKYFPFLQEIIGSYKPIRPVSFVIFIFTSIVIIYDIINLIIAYISRLIKNSLWSIKRKLNSLNDSEKAILREFFLQTKGVKLPINNPDIAELIKKGILSVPPHGYVKNLPVGIIKYVEISYYAERLLKLMLIDWPETKPTKKQFDFIIRNRPLFMRVIESEHPFDEWIRG